MTDGSPSQSASSPPQDALRAGSPGPAAVSESTPAGRRPRAEMDPAVTTIQPGGGPVMEIELAWGKLRRGLLRRFRPAYVERMRAARQGQAGGLPFEPVDPRDMKYYCNQASYWWPAELDRFRWRDRLPFVRAGLAELLLIGGFFLLLTLALVWLWWPAAMGPAVVLALVVWFFRDPRRAISQEAGMVVAPADGKVVLIERLEDPEIGPAVQVGIFLSIFNVHANRAAAAGRVIELRYRPGKFLNALRPESARENEQLEIVLESPEAPYPLMKIRQITGQFARRIVCWVRPGDQLQRGEMFGMIKLGSRTELLIPDSPGLELLTQVGEKIKAGSSLIARYRSPGEPVGSPRQEVASHE